MRTKTHEPKKYNLVFTLKNGKTFGNDLSTIDEVSTFRKEIMAFLKINNIVSITIKKGWQE